MKKKYIIKNIILIIIINIIYFLSGKSYYNSKMYSLESERNRNNKTIIHNNLKINKIKKKKKLIIINHTLIKISEAEYLLKKKL